MRNLLELIADAFESFSAKMGVLHESVNAKVFNLVTKLAPGKIGLEFCMLVEQSSIFVVRVGAVGHGFVHGKNLGKREVLRTHNKNLVFGVHLANFANVGNALAAKQRLEPSRRCLTAGNEPLGAQNASDRVNFSSQNINSFDVSRDLVRIFVPVGLSDVFPVVVKFASGVEKTHGSM